MASGIWHAANELEKSAGTREVWVGTNQRAYRILAIPPAILLICCAFLLCVATSRLVIGLTAALLVASGLAWLLVVRRGQQPRLAYCNQKLLVYLRRGRPIEVPIDIVECFFLGQAPSLLPRSLHGQQGEASDASAVVVRLAENAGPWHHVDVHPSLGQWCEGYITVRGTWCEPLSGELVVKLNRRLVEAHRARRAAAAEVESP